MKAENELELLIFLVKNIGKIRKLYKSEKNVDSDLKKVKKSIIEILDKRECKSFLTDKVGINIDSYEDISDKNILGKLLNIAYEEGDRFLTCDLNIYHSDEDLEIELTIYRIILYRLAMYFIEKKCEKKKRKRYTRKLYFYLLVDYKNMGYDSVPSIKIKDTFTGKYEILEEIPFDDRMNNKTLDNFIRQKRILDLVDHNKENPFLQYGHWLKETLCLDISIPNKQETSAITLIPKTASLLYDRIWSPSRDIVPDSIRCWGGSFNEYLGVMRIITLYDSYMKKDLREENSKIFKNNFINNIYDILKIKVNQGPWKLEINSDVNKIKMREIEEFFYHNLHSIAQYFSNVYNKPLVPIYENEKDRDKLYSQGDRETILMILSNLSIVDEDKLTWEQVIGFRDDKDTQRKYKRFYHWLNKEMVDQSQAFIEDELSIRLEDYECALKKHGIKTIIGTVEEALNGEFFLGTCGVMGSLTLIDHPLLGFLAGSGLIIGKVGIKLVNTFMDYEDVESGHNSEISWVYKAKQLSK
jgi:hypothetical protein